MELLLKNTDIFDLDLYDKIDQVFKERKSEIENEICYKFEFVFHLNLLYGEKMKEYYDKFVPKKAFIDNKCRNEKDDIYDYLGYVIDKIHIIMKNHDIELDDLTITGDNIRSENSIIMSLQKSMRKSESQETKKRDRRNKAKHIIVYNIMPSRPSIQAKAFHFFEKEINQIFDHYLEMTGEKAMSQVLGINETYNIRILFREFIDQYAHLYKCCGEGDIDELHEKFKERAQIVWNKNYAKDNDILNDK